GWDVAHIARAWTVLMKRLEYTQFVAQGGDWGAVVVDRMGVDAPPELLGIHTNMAGVFPAEIDQAAFLGKPVRVPDGAASADVIWNRGLACRAGGVFPGSRCTQLRVDLTRLPGENRG